MIFRRKATTPPAANTPSDAPAEPAPRPQSRPQSGPQSDQAPDATPTPTAPALEQALQLSKPDSSQPSVDYFDGLGTELRISHARYDETTGKLEVNGWCLTPEPRFDLFLAVKDTNVVHRIQPREKERLDVHKQYPQYNDKRSGWQIELRLPDLPDTVTTVQAYYNSALRYHLFELPIRRVATALPAEKAAAQEAFKVTKCTYSPLRSLARIDGTLKSQRPDLAFSVTLSSGRKIAPLHAVTGSEPNEKGLISWCLEFALTGLTDGETVIIEELGNPDNREVKNFAVGNDSPRRTTASKASVKRDIAAAENTLSLKTVFDLQTRLSGLHKKKKNPGEICFYPPFEDAAELSNHYHRASWYLTGEDSPINRVTFYDRQAGEAPGAAPEYFASRNLDRGNLDVITSEDVYVTRLLQAGTVMVWRPVPEGTARFLAGVLGKPNVITVATDDPSAVEYGNYCRPPWMLLPDNQKRSLLQESQDRFRAALDKQRAAGKTCSAVFGTGPSLDRAVEFDFSDCMTVTCNSIVSNDALLDHIRPAFICAGDAVSHFGVSQYAETFRSDLIRALTERDIYFFTSAPMGYLLIQKHPEIRDRVILCEQRFNGVNTELETAWALPRFDSTLNIHMLPIAASFSDTIYLLGLDGKAPNPEQNEDFWAHSQSAQYHDLVDSGHLAHPSFAINRLQATEGRYLASVEESFTAGECLGKSYFSLAPSYTPAVHARPAPAHCFAPGGPDNAPKRLQALSPETAPVPAARPAAKRALIVTQITRRYFSGGRYHGTMLAEALAEFCDEVVVWANNTPPWSGDLGFSPNHAKVRYWIDDHVQVPEGDFDYVIVLPDGARNPAMYHKAYAKAQSCGAKTVFINFESPNWFNALSPAPKDLRQSDTWFAAACFSDIILSSAETAQPFAKSFYQTLYHTPTFAVASPSINDGIADLVKQEALPREKQIILISRFKNSSAHKNIDAIFDIITPEMQGYTLALIAGTSELPGERDLEAFRARLADRGLTLKLLYMISDRQKFEEIAKSELMIFPSLFEGFGYPPVEAGYMGTPCVIYDLPVLQEFNHDHAHAVPWGDSTALRDKVSELLRMAPEDRLRTDRPEVLDTATLAHFSRSLKSALDSAPGGAATAFSPEKFELARTVYLDGVHDPQLTCGRLSPETLSTLAERYSRYTQMLQDVFDRMQAQPGAPR